MGTSHSARIELLVLPRPLPHKMRRSFFITDASSFLNSDLLKHKTSKPFVSREYTRDLNVVTRRALDTPKHPHNA